MDALCKSNVVYKINCKDCSENYVGQTSRQLKIRISEHKRDVINKKDQSAPFQHTSQFNHNLDFDEVSILNIETQYYNRLFLAMLNIEFNNSRINRITDSNNLRNSYKYFLKKVKKYI